MLRKNALVTEQSGRTEGNSPGLKSWVWSFYISETVSFKEYGVFRVSLRTDALYQGTALAGPFPATPDLGFQPLRFFLCQIGVAVGVLLGAINESCFDGIFKDIGAML
jgi:hypothetical protein